MGFPWKAFTASSILGSYVLVGHKPSFLFTNRPTYLGTFILLFFAQFLSWLFYNVILWPKLLSPLRHLPQPSGNSWWNGQFGRIRNEPSGGPMREW